MCARICCVILDMRISFKYNYSDFLFYSHIRQYPAV